MNKKNYAKVTEEIIQNHIKEHRIPSLLIHSCCAPCSSSVIEYLSQHFKITVFYFNPNITDAAEYEMRKQEQKNFLNEFKTDSHIDFIEGNYIVEDFYNFATPLSNKKEGGMRCFKCYQLRLDETARKAKEGNYDYFATTLTVSPLKNAEKINEIGRLLESKYQVDYLYSDFKKKEGYKRSIELSQEYNLYRQNYCGCEFSKNNDSTKMMHDK